MRKTILAIVTSLLLIAVSFQSARATQKDLQVVRATHRSRRAADWLHPATLACDAMGFSAALDGSMDKCKAKCSEVRMLLLGYGPVGRRPNDLEGPCAYLDKAKRLYQPEQ